jgi:hypothetical protein
LALAARGSIIRAESEADVDNLFPVCAGAGQCFIFVLVAAGIVALIVYSVINARKRREAAARFAADLGFQYYPDDPFDIPSRYGQFELFGRGHSRSASNVICGQIDGRDVTLCDYRYTTGSGKNKTTHYYQAALQTMPILGARLEMRRESLFDRVASWVGHDDINFESAEFSRLYHVKCDDRKFAYDIFHARLIEYLLACGTAPTIEMSGPTLLVCDTQGDLEKLRRLMAVGQEIIRSIPEYVLNQRGIGRQQGGQT